jgi:IclR family KDG regulon transcriptional repressor
LAESAGSSYVPALRKGLGLLELLAEHGQMSLAQVERASGLNRTMAYRLLRVLDELGYVRHDPVRHRYELGSRLLGLGAITASRMDLAEIAWPLLERVRNETQETITLAVMTGNQVVYLGLLHGSPGTEQASRLAGRHAAHATASGKAILAFLPEEPRQITIVSLDLYPITSNTIIDLEALERELSRSRERGYALENEEHTVGMRGVGVPVLDTRGYPVAALGLSGPIERFDLADAGETATRLWSASRELSRRVGHAQGAL